MKFYIYMKSGMDDHVLILRLGLFGSCYLFVSYVIWDFEVQNLLGGMDGKALGIFQSVLTDICGILLSVAYFRMRWF